MKAQELCRKYGISDATFCKYNAKFGGMNLSDAKKLRALEDENNRLKRMRCWTTLHLRISRQKLLTPDVKRGAMSDVMDRHDCTREALVTVVDRSLSGARMTRELDKLI